MITCSKCGQAKHNYNFFRYINTFGRWFFITGVPAKSNVCFECAGPYRCLNCGETKDHTHFRVMGRICNECKSGREIASSLDLFTSKTGGNATSKAQHPQDAENALESEFQE